jgi:hypothetical protein
MTERFFVDVLLDSGSRLQSKMFETHQDAARVAHEFAERLMVEVAIVIDRKTGEVKHSIDGIIRTTRRCWGRKQA